MKPKLSIIIVNFNTEDFLGKCLESLFINYKKQLVGGEYEVIVVDNASKQDPKDLLGKKYPQVLFVHNSTNTGFAHANNLGIAKSHGEYVLLLNPDTVVPKKTISTTLLFMEKNRDVGIATCRVNLVSGKLDDACHRGFPTPWRAFCHFSGFSQLFPSSILLNGYHLGYQNLDKVHEIDSCAGAFMMIQREIGEKLQWLDEDYFWYGEDLDFCYQVKNKGLKVMFVPSVKITHYKGVASGIKKHSEHLSAASEKTKEKATKARFDVMRIFYQKHYKDKYPWIVTQLVFIGIKLKYYFVKMSL